MAERILYLDALRVAAIIAVIVLHVAAPLVQAFPGLPPGAWEIANLFDAAARFAVPMFFMISGALVLGDPRHCSLSYLLGKRVLRLVIPLLLWSLLYLSLHPLPDNPGFAGRLARVASEPGFFHLWFLYALLGVYLLVPLISVFAAAADRNGMRYFLLLWGVITLFNPLLKTLTGYALPLFALPAQLIDPFLYLGYFVLGYCLHRHAGRPNRWLIALLIAGGICTTFWLTDYFTHRQGQFYEYFYRYNTPNVLAASVGIFLLAKSWEGRFAALPLRLRQALTRLSALAFGVYLAHPLVLNLISHYLNIPPQAFYLFDQQAIQAARDYLGWHVVSLPPALAIPLAALGIFLISALFTYLLQRIPLLGKWVA